MRPIELFRVVFGFVIAAFALSLAAPGVITAAYAEPGKPAAAEPCNCPPPAVKDVPAPQPSGRDRPNPRPKFAELRHHFDASDEMAALESVQLALSEVGDGSTYVWHRGHGQLSGLVQPTASYRDPGGTVCRHLMVMLTSGLRVRKVEGVACREPTGRWRLDG